MAASLVTGRLFLLRITLEWIHSIRSCLWAKAYRTVSPAGLAAKGDSMIHALQPSPALKLAAP
jgi:hypothetical protein